MKSLVIATLAAGTLGITALGLANVAVAAPSGPSTVESTITQLQTKGYTVILNRQGGAELSQCRITAVRPGQTYSRTDSGAPGAGDDLVTTVTSKTVFVDATC